MPHDSLSILNTPSMPGSTLLLALTGWMDGGDVSTGTVKNLMEDRDLMAVGRVRPGGFYIDSMSTVEIGGVGSAVAGVLTIDPGATVSAGVDTSLQTPGILDNGVIRAAGGTP